MNGKSNGMYAVGMSMIFGPTADPLNYERWT